MRKTKEKNVTKTINNYKNFDENKFKAEIEATPWSVCEIFNDLEDQVWAWKRLFKNIASAHIPKRKVRTRTNSLPWLNLEIRKAQNKRCKLLKQYKEKKGEETWQLYNQLRNKIQTMLKEAEMVYWRNQFDKASNSKEFWQVVRKVNGKTKKKSIPLINDGNGNMLTSDLEKAESINDYFANIGKELANNFNSNETNIEKQSNIVAIHDANKAISKLKSQSIGITFPSAESTDGESTDGMKVKVFLDATYASLDDG